MAREVTRTIKQTQAHVVSTVVENGSANLVDQGVITIFGNFKSQNAIEMALRNQHPELTAPVILDQSVVETTYSMTEKEFLEHATAKETVEDETETPSNEA